MKENGTLELIDTGFLETLPDGVPCSHPGCLNHVTHPCEGCGRISGRSKVDGLLWMKKG